MHITSFPSPDVPAKYHTPLDDLLTEAYGPDKESDDGDFEHPYEPHQTFIATDETHGIVGHLAAYVRMVDFGDAKRPLGMIGNVATAKIMRHQGIAKQMVAMAHDHFLAQNVPWSILFAYDPPVYTSSGYRPMLNQITFQDGDGSWKTLVHRGGMYCELGETPWPDGLIHLNGCAV